MNTPKLDTEYRAKLALNNNVICSVTGSDRKAIHETVQNLITQQSNLTPTQKGGPVRFEDTENNSSLIFHNSYLDGNQPLGWIAEYDVPGVMSVQAITEQRFRAQKVA